MRSRSDALGLPAPPAALAPTCSSSAHAHACAVHAGGNSDAPDPRAAATSSE
jgi:hypothetical protein